MTTKTLKEKLNTIGFYKAYGEDSLVCKFIEYFGELEKKDGYGFKASKSINGIKLMSDYDDYTIGICFDDNCIKEAVLSLDHFDKDMVLKNHLRTIDDVMVKYDKLEDRINEVKQEVKAKVFKEILEAKLDNNEIKSNKTKI
ncbi:hypothetical protein K6L09_21040 [Burkholderia cepacia]